MMGYGDSQSRFRDVLALIGLCGLGAAGCDLADGLADVGGSLANPDAALLDSPGRKLASGSYTRLLVDGSLTDGGHVIALRTDRGKEEAAIIPYLEGDGCSIEPAVGFERLSSRIDVELDGVLSLQRGANEAGRGDISFIDFKCKEAFDGLPQSTLPQIAFPSLSPQGLLALTADQDLFLVNVVRGSLDLIAPGVSLARTSGDFLWSIENGELTVRNGEFNEVARMGTNVTDFALPGGTDIEVAFMDEAGLSVWNAKDGVTHLGEDACEPVSLGVDTIGYLAPCAERRLQIYTLGSLLGLEDEFVHLVGEAGTTDHGRTLTSWGQGTRASEILYLTSGENGDRLVLGTAAEDLEFVEGTAQLTTTELADNSATIRGGVIFTDWDGLTGTLMDQERDDHGLTAGLLALASQVAQLPGSTPYSSFGVLTNFEANVGMLEVIRKSGDEVTTTLVAEGVPLQNQSVEAETGRRAFIGDSEDGIIGNLYLTDEPSNIGSSLPKARKVGEYAHVETARFLDQPRALAYLSRKPGEQYATLKAWLIDSGLTVTIHERVSEYRTVPWPAPGILYAVPSGDDAGLWFSKAR